MAATSLSDKEQKRRASKLGVVSAPWAAVHCRYLPLELLNNDFKHMDKADIFSLGCTLYELGTGQVRGPYGCQPTGCSWCCNKLAGCC
jgi:hypothetical protein